MPVEGQDVMAVKVDDEGRVVKGGFKHKTSHRVASTKKRTPPKKAS